jgi:hypothetical protein
MAVKTFTTGEVLTAADTNTYLANSGLVYITSAAFTAASSVSVNNCFTTTYTNYRLIVSNTELSTSTSILCRFRASGADNTNPNYNWAQRGIYTSGATGDDSSNNSTSWATGAYSSAGAGYPYVTIAADIFGPQKAQATNATNMANGFAGATLLRMGGLCFYGTNQFDGFTLFVTTGTMTGRYAVYGYREA